MIRTRIWKKFRGCLNLLLGIVFRKRGILSLHFKLLQEWRFPSTSFSILHNISYFRDLATFLLMDDKVVRNPISLLTSGKLVCQLFFSFFSFDIT